MTATLLHGYHIGVQDAAIYLPAIKHHLDPALYPHDFAIVTAQARLTLFDEALAGLARVSHVPLEALLLLLHVLVTFGLLFGCWRIAAHCFPGACSRWCAVVLVAAASPLPVAGTLLRVDEVYLHPRRVATAALLLAFAGLLERRRRAAGWLALAFGCHPQMAAWGLFHLVVQAWPARRVPVSTDALAALAPLDGWTSIVGDRRHLFPGRWNLAEWAGAVFPLLACARIVRTASRVGATRVAQVARRLAVAVVLALAAALVLPLGPVTPALLLDPMRALHFAYVLIALLGGGLIGQVHLASRPRLRVALSVILAAVALMTARLSFASSGQVEVSAQGSSNPYVQAFAWVRNNTPATALFALDPEYLRQPGADMHGFRALAERSMLADAIKDRAVTLYEPALVERVEREIAARSGWRSFDHEDFRRLGEQYGVNWVVVAASQRPGLRCPYEKAGVLVCRVD